LKRGLDTWDGALGQAFPAFSIARLPQSGHFCVVGVIYRRIGW